MRSLTATRHVSALLSMLAALGLAGCPASTMSTTCLDNDACEAHEICLAGRCVVLGSDSGGGPDAGADAFAGPDSSAVDGDVRDAGDDDAATGISCTTGDECADGIACTENLCVEGMCRIAAFDDDGDGYPAARVGGTSCADGTDCDDYDDDVHPDAVETCNGDDDDCNGIADDGCLAIPGEDCATAIGIPLALTGLPGEQRGTVSGDTSAMRDDYRTSCGSSAASGGDAVYFIEVSDGLEVMIEIVDPSFDSILSIGNGCDASALADDCNDDFDPGGLDGSRLFLHHAEVVSTSTRYYILVDGNDGSGGAFTLNVVTRTPPRVDTCTDPLDITGGGTVIGLIEPATFFGSSGSCQGASESTELQGVFTFAAPSDGNVRELTATSDDFSPDVYVRSTACSMGTERACLHGGTADETTLTDIALAPMTLGIVFVDGAMAGDRYRLDYDP